MSNGSAVEAATRRLAAALDGLEAALDRRRETDGRQDALAAQLTAFGADRSRLAADLDEQSARGRRLEAASRETAQRLDAAMAAVRTIAGEERAS